jgi:hypothetical protein
MSSMLVEGHLYVAAADMKYFRFLRLPPIIARIILDLDAVTDNTNR